MTFKILTLDGGGIRGVLSATILKQVETTLHNKKGKKLHEYFDLVSGTSTGSILTAGIACQMSAEQMIEIYLKEGNNIFLKSVRQLRKFMRLSQALGSLLLYPHERGEQGLAKILQKKLIHPELGKDLKISQITKPHILIPAYDVYSRNTTWFVDGNPDAWYYNLELWKICTASASAPTFFPPYELPYNYDQSLPHIDGGVLQSLPHIDGGVSANNPALLTLAHALSIGKNNANQPGDEQNRLKLNDIAILSIGTGNTTRSYTGQKIKGWGQLGWASHLPDMFMSPAAQNSETICYEIMASAGGDYLRLDFDLNERLEGEREPGRLRPLLDQPYNKYIAQVKKKHEEVSEDIDNPDNCTALMEAAACYLDCGEVDYKNQKIRVQKAIEQFIEFHD